MRNAIFIMFVVVFQAMAVSSYSQVTMFSVKENNMELTELFRQIEKQSEFLFFYVDADVKDIYVNIDLKNENIQTILEKVLNKTGLTYEINDRNVNILRKSKIYEPLQSGKRQITGVVIDEQGIPVIGANVLEKGTTNGSITNVDGQFSLSVSANAILQISYIGY